LKETKHLLPGVKLIKASRPCPVCANVMTEVLHHQRFALRDRCPLPEAYDVVACHGCGFVYADIATVQRSYNRYYQEFSTYEDISTSTGGGGTYRDAKRLENTASDIIRFVHDKNAAIIDIGCANGGLLAELKRRGYDNLTGMDPSRACVEHVENQGMRAVHGELSSPISSAIKKLFDCVILSHVLEHIRDLQIAVKECTSLLKTGGILYVEVPDASRYPDYFIVPYYYFDCEHINHFDENSLRNLILPSGCEYVAAFKKDIEVSDAEIYPAVYAIFRKVADLQAKCLMNVDFGVRESVVDYVKKSNGIQHRDIDEFVRTQEKIIVWGAGSYTFRLLESSSLGKCKIVAFVDRDTKKQGTHLKGVPISSPEILDNFAGPIVLCTALHNEEIITEIQERQLKNKIVVIH
jgi:SAM-dependent methyltransferase